MNRWAGRNTIYWDEFAPFIWRNRAYWSKLKFYPPIPPRTPPDVLTIVDGHLPLREEIVHTGHTHDDWDVASIAANGGWLKGEIPVVWTKLHKDDHQRPVYGVISVVKRLLHYGCLRPTQDVADLLSIREYVGDVRRYIPDKFSIVRLQT